MLLALSIILSLASPNLTQAQPPLTEQPVTNSQCLVCSFPVTTESSTPGQAQICDDLYGAACLTPKGKQKFGDHPKAIQEELDKIIRDARDKSAVLLGYKSFDDGLMERLKTAGIDLTKQIDPLAWQNLIQGDNNSDSGPGKNMFAIVDQCEKEAGALKKKVDPTRINEIEYLRQTERKMNSFQQKYQQARIGFYAQDIPNFMSYEVTNKCSSIKNKNNDYLPAQNKKIFSVCEDITNVQAKAIELFRMEQKPEYKEAAEKFVKETILPEFVYGPAPTPSVQTDLGRLQDKLNMTSNGLLSQCYSLATPTKSAAKRVFADFASEINKMKPTIETILSAIYDEGTKTKTTQVFREARADVKEIASQFIADPKKLDKILTSYDRMDLLWLDQPEESLYKVNEKEIPVLDDNKSLSQFLGTHKDTVFTVFGDPSLSFLKRVNADYMPHRIVGAYSFEERVNIYPFILQLSKSNPYTLLSIMAHEIGHKIGPEVGKMNGYDLTPEYEALVNCYKEEASVRMQNNQRDEGIADYISSEVLARQLAKLPVEKRRQALIAAVSGFCVLESSKPTPFFNFREDHVIGPMRVSGIYGANPNLRSIIGCAGDSPKFKSCGLNLSLPATSQTNTGEKGAQ